MDHNFCVSPLLQSLSLEFSQCLPFERSCKLLNAALPAAELSASQSQRLVQYYGSMPEVEAVLRQASSGKPQEEQCSTEQAEEQVLYCQVDGGMLLTDDGYKETKVGRLFRAQALKLVSSQEEQVDKRMKIEQSDYLAHLGNCKEFTARFDGLIKSHLEAGPEQVLLIITDGAPWIESWHQEEYPEAVTILDFYHAIKHLADFAVMAFSSPARRSEWLEQRKGEIRKGKLDDAIGAIDDKATGRRASIKEAAARLIAYYENNRYRMKYDEYRAKGYCIGSGAIESAISTVVQQRCKLVGQRWTDRVTAVLNLRALHMSAKKDKLVEIINQKMGLAFAA